MYTFLHWLDIYIFDCHWHWLCQYLSAYHDDYPPDSFLIG